MRKPTFEECVTMLRSDDAAIYENGYHWLLEDVDDYLERLVALMVNEETPELRGRLVELVGDSRQEAVIPVLEAELNSPHHEVRRWAYDSLSHFDTPEARRVVAAYQQARPTEDFI